MLFFKKLKREHGVPETQVELLTGTATVFVQPVPHESFVLESVAKNKLAFMKTSFVRVDSYIDGMALTPQPGDGNLVLHFGKQNNVPVQVGETILPKSPALGWERTGGATLRL